MPQIGRPAMKARVPSIGSSTQTYSASRRLGAELLAEDAVGREGALDQLAHRRPRRPGRPRSRDRRRRRGTCPRPRALVRKKGRIACPDKVASSLTNCVKSIGPMRPGLRRSPDIDRTSRYCRRIGPVPARADRGSAEHANSGVDAAPDVKGDHDMRPTHGLLGRFALAFCAAHRLLLQCGRAMASPYRCPSWAFPP